MSTGVVYITIEYLQSISFFNHPPLFHTEDLMERIEGFDVGDYFLGQGISH